MDVCCEWFVECLTDLREKHALDLWACVIMPEHVHLLIYPREEDYSISKILYDLKHPFTHRALKYFREHDPTFLGKMRDERPNGKVHSRFWQRGGGYDRNMFNARTIHATIDYIHNNPVRRGLVCSPECWKWSTANCFLQKKPALIEPDLAMLPHRESI